MDIKSQVSARRTELARQAEEAAAEESRREQEQRAVALDALAQELSKTGTSVNGNDKVLAIAEESPLAALDPDDFKRDSLRNMLYREARLRWTPQQNWAVIGTMTAGILLLIPAFPLGALLIGLGLVFRQSFNSRHKMALIKDFPNLFVGIR